jgi:hypothetical protein
LWSRSKSGIASSSNESDCGLAQNIRTRLNQWAELLFPRDNNKFALGDKALSARLSIMNAEMARDRKNEARVKTHIAREFLEKAKQFFAEVPVNPR